MGTQKVLKWISSAAILGGKKGVGEIIQREIHNQELVLNV